MPGDLTSEKYYVLSQSSFVFIMAHRRLPVSPQFSNIRHRNEKPTKKIFLHS